MERREMKKIIRQAAVMIIGAAVIGLFVNIVHPKGYIFVPRASLEEKRIVMVSVEEAKIKFDGERALFIDTREREEYWELHIQSADNIPAAPESLALERVKALYGEIAGPRELVLYCDRGCNSAETLAGLIVSLGYSRHIYVLKDGFGSWIEKGFPVESDSKKQPRQQ